MYKINHFLFLKGSYEINWYEERRRNTRQTNKKNLILSHSQPEEVIFFSPSIQIPILIGTLRNIAYGQISSRATCDSTLKINNECLSGAFEIL